MNRAIKAAKESTDFDALHEGIQLIQKQIHNVLERKNVSIIDAIGKNFDPNLHEAIAQVESDLPMNTIVEEFQVGYKLRDRVLRASMDSVSQGQSNPEINDENTTEDKENTTETVTANDDNAPAEEPNKTDEEIATDFTECMRDEGFELPDPELNADGSVNVEAIRDNLIADPNFDFQSRKTQQSLQKCVPLLEGATFVQQPSEEELVEFQDNLLQFEG